MRRDGPPPDTGAEVGEQATGMRLRPALTDLLIVLGVSWVARALFVAVFGYVYSFDVDYWRVALETLDEGRNPYETGLINWPPLWLVLIVGIDAGAELTGISFLSALRVFLVLVESGVVVALYGVLVTAVRTARSRESGARLPRRLGLPRRDRRVHCVALASTVS